MAIEAFRSDEPDDLDSDAGGWGVCEGVIVKLNFELYKSLFFSSNVYKFVWTITGCHGISIKEPCVGSLTSVVGNGLMSRLNCVNPDVLLCCEALWRCHFDLKYSVNILVDHLKKTCWNIFQQINLHIYIYIFVPWDANKSQNLRFAIRNHNHQEETYLKMSFLFFQNNGNIMDIQGYRPPNEALFLGICGIPLDFPWKHQHPTCSNLYYPTCDSHETLDPHIQLEPTSGTVWNTEDGPKVVRSAGLGVGQDEHIRRSWNQKSEGSFTIWNGKCVILVAKFLVNSWGSFFVSSYLTGDAKHAGILVMLTMLGHVR